MPELPEVETIVRTLKEQILGRRIDSLEVPKPEAVQAGADLLPALPGSKVADVRRRAKLLLMRLSGKEDLILAFHLKMTGRFFVHPENTPAMKHTRLILNIDGGDRLFFDDMRTFGYCRIMRPADLADWPFYATLGPEPLELAPEELAASLQGAFQGRKISIKAALLDQRNVAGIGNIYADEALFRARIAPQRPASSLNPADLRALVCALREILLRSIAECGSSIRDYRDAFGRAGAFQNSFSVYGRGGQNCLSCGNALKSVRIAGRGTVYCRHCQK
ncbi:MAG: bifunctional DNA-formamidopyrimidine glycosylase/DNA-(apurinic or apyrimidinic site) lyase [Desulfovibrio sp.]|jgi:formamidopyrimidine-DNA glycosylase|nr:bifunctional DNA-formamidopyrimidine glycosylase/DNA-(apurinic or apyrimidinic site) lyase [Desulfovibrio sp.]